MSFPAMRPRRLRSTGPIRELVAETRLSPGQLVYPLFVCPGEGVKKEISAMPGNYHWSVDTLVEEVRAVKALGIGGVMLFGVPGKKDDLGSGAWDDGGIVQRALGALKREVPGIVLIGDVCLCEYTTHGHCGVVSGGEIANDETLELLARTALSQVRAGADMVAPSDMMDGRVGAIRSALDAHGFQSAPIMSYAVKYASGYYGPFREAAGSAPAFGDRRSHQMDPANAREALREIDLDIEEGADIIMVKPAGPCLDILRMARDRCPLPLAAYQVSGEYSALVAAGRMGWLDLPRTMMESLIGIRRAGADIILTYFAKEAAEVLA
ncbi:MAG: porphobilinogen synthase [Acidobacteriota bacterium]|jgi:porphobilinogen synthase|nr:porphobilinogen synthase [Acidobacteriota bacterium]NLT33078.1 porphobilinogen synthase [Acidobacteriota bacterium]